jgi:ectoine hydroxylase-related dioxygenase (phytanoyl-CoA dioxygenase family)
VDWCVILFRQLKSLERLIRCTGTFFSAQSRRVYGCCGKSLLFAESIVGHPVWNSVCDVLLSSTHTSYTQYKQEILTSPPQVCNTTVYSVLPGSEEQALHRDDRIHHAHLPQTEKHTVGRDLGIGLFVAGSRSTRKNGATRFIPGSHLWDYSWPPPLNAADLEVQAELEPGDAFLMLSGCYHGASANRCKPNDQDTERLLYGTFFCKATLRQEENQYLANDLTKIKDYPDRLLRIMGFEISKPFLGWVEMGSPMAAIRMDTEQQKGMGQSHLL